MSQTAATLTSGCDSTTRSNKEPRLPTPIIPVCVGSLDCAEARPAAAPRTKVLRLRFMQHIVVALHAAECRGQHFRRLRPGDGENPIDKERGNTAHTESARLRFRPPNFLGAYGPRPLDPVLFGDAP